MADWLKKVWALDFSHCGHSDLNFYVVFLLINALFTFLVHDRNGLKKALFKNRIKYCCQAKRAHNFGFMSS